MASYKNKKGDRIRTKYRYQVMAIALIAALIVGGVCIFYLKKHRHVIPPNEQIESTNPDNQLGGAIHNEQAEQEEEKEQEKEEETIQYIGVNLEGQKYAYDASKIAEKFRNGNASNESEKIVFLTFDDGISTTVTPKILRTLDEYNVKATFFVIGETVDKGGERARELIKEEFEKGHAIANHSYSHNYHTLYPGRSLNLSNFKADFKKTDDLLKDILGENFSTRVVRCPGGYMSWNNMEQLDHYLNESNKVSIDWNALSKDAEGKKKNAEQLLENVKRTTKGKEIVVLLMHDTYGKEETAKALPEVIRYFKNNGYAFKTLV